MLSSSDIHHSNNDQYENPFASAAESDPFASSAAYIEPDLDLSGQSTSRPTTTTQPEENPFAKQTISGSIGSSNHASRSTANAQQSSSFSYEYTGEDTLDEPVSITIVMLPGANCAFVVIQHMKLTTAYTSCET